MRSAQTTLFRFLPLVAALCASYYGSPAAAATMISLGHAAGAQCTATGVNDSGIAAGVCMPGNAAGTPTAWVANAGNEVALTRLPGGEACGAGGITNSGTVIGSCLSAVGTPFAVTWNSESPGLAPVALAPLPGLLGLAAGVRTSANAFNQSGFIGGESAQANGASTAVIWAPGSAVAIQVSAVADNCQVVDVADSSGASRPTVLLNCPNGSGTTTAKIATATGLLGAYATSTLASSPASDYCVAAALNNAAQILGTCVLPIAPFAKAAFWTSPSAVPALLMLPAFSGDAVGRRSSGKFLNNLGHLVYQSQTADGRQNAGYIDPAANTPRSIPGIQSGAVVTAKAFGDNDLVVVVGENANSRLQAAVFNPAVPAAVTPIIYVGGATSSSIDATSMGGQYAVGIAEDANRTVNAVITSLP